MDMKDLYALVVVDDPAVARDWYVRHLGFVAVVETDWFVYLASSGQRPFALAFMRAGLDSQLPQFRTALTGSALIVTIEVADVRETLAAVLASGAEPAEPLRDEPWGQRHFMLRDPAGVWVDIVQQIPPQPGYLDEAAELRLTELTNASGG